MIWLPIIKPKWYYTNVNNAIWYFDYANIWAVETYPTCELIIDKKYKISRGSLTMLWSQETKKKHGIDFVYTDYKWLNKRDRFTSLWVNKEENIPELLFLFWMFNSFLCQRQFIEDFGTNVNKTNLSLLKFPKIDSPIKEKLKAQLIENSEKIINLCKNWASTITTRKDICETAIDTDSMQEIIVWIKPEYAWKNIIIPQDIIPSDTLPTDIIELIWSTNAGLKQLEDERDSIVEKLYELK